MIHEYQERAHATTGDTRKLEAEPLDVWHLIPTELPFATRRRIERRAWQLLAAPTVRAIRVAICAAGLLVGGLLTLAGWLTADLDNAMTLFGLAAAALIAAFVGRCAWFQDWT